MHAVFWGSPIALLALTVACGEPSTGLPTLFQLSEPDTNTAVVVLDATLRSAHAVLDGGQEYVFRVREDRVPHTLLAELVIGGDTARVAFVLSELYRSGPVRTDGVGNLFYVVAPDGRRFDPVRECTLEVTEAYEFGTPSTQAVETACEVQDAAGARLTALVKARRFSSLGSG